MMLYLLLTGILLVQVRGLIYMTRTRRDDEVRMRFCELQSDITKFLCTDESLELSKADYLHIRRLLYLTSVTVQRFEQLKPSLNFRAFLRNIREVNTSVTKQEISMVSTSNERIQGFYAAFSQGVIRGFFAYTPFIRHELFLRVLKATAVLVANIGTERVKRIVNEVQNIVVHLNKREQHQANPALCVAN